MTVPGYSTTHDHSRYVDACPLSPLHAAAGDLLAALEDAAKIVGKVVADDLMPSIVAPGFPVKALERIDAAIRQARGQ